MATVLRGSDNFDTNEAIAQIDLSSLSSNIKLNVGQIGNYHFSAVSSFLLYLSIAQDEQYEWTMDAIGTSISNPYLTFDDAVTTSVTSHHHAAVGTTFNSVATGTDTVFYFGRSGVAGVDYFDGNGVITYNATRVSLTRQASMSDVGIQNYIENGVSWKPSYTPSQMGRVNFAAAATGNITIVRIK